MPKVGNSRVVTSQGTIGYVNSPDVISPPPAKQVSIPMQTVGINGKDGKDGKDGTNGTNGINGTNGTNGINGTNGKDGKDGIDGSLVPHNQLTGLQGGVPGEYFHVSQSEYNNIQHPRLKTKTVSVSTYTLADQDDDTYIEVTTACTVTINNPDIIQYPVGGLTVFHCNNAIVTVAGATNTIVQNGGFTVDATGTIITFAIVRRSATQWDVVAPPTTPVTDSSFTWRDKTTNYTLVLADQNKGVAIDSTLPITVTVPLDSNVLFAIGTSILITQDNTGATTIVGDVGVTVNKRGGGAIVIAGQFGIVTLIKRAANTWIAAGDL